MRVLSILLATVALPLLPVTAIASSTGAHDHGKHEHGPTTSGEAGNPARVTRTVTIRMSEYAFDTERLEFKAGETVKFIVINNGKLKHELTVGTAEEQKAHRAAMQSMSDMNHDEHSHEMPANAIHVNPGETRELVWHFTKAGSLQFACNYPGHADLGMEGSIAVR
jgi:uncharacterized cupredoxin-like copper-binding protein